jgi:hypothetical protein
MSEDEEGANADGRGLPGWQASKPGNPGNRYRAADIEFKAT